MVSSWCAGFLLFTATSCSLACPSFTRTIRGLLALNFVIVNYIASISDFYANEENEYSVLPVVATILMLIEHSKTMNKQEHTLSRSEQLKSVSVLVFLNIGISYAASKAIFEVSVIIFLTLGTVVIFASSKHFKKPSELTKEELYYLKSSDLFADSESIFSCFGLLGFIHFAGISTTTLLLIPEFNNLLLAKYIVYVARSLGTLSMFFTPAFFGGFVHSVKTLGAKFGLKRLKSPSYAQLRAQS